MSGTVTRRRAKILAVVVLLLLPAVCARASKVVPGVQCAAVTVPDKTEQMMVASNIVIDNRLMTIIGARSALPPASFAAFYKNLWKGDGVHPLYVENIIGQWNVVAHKEGDCFYTIQMARAANGTQALIGVGTPGSRVSIHEALDFPAPGDARTLTHMVSEDRGTIGDTWLLYTGNSAADTVAYYHSTLAAVGWLPLMPAASSARNGGTVMMFRKGNRNVGIVVAPFRRGSTITFTVTSR